MEHSRILPTAAPTGSIPLPGILPPAPAVMRILDRFNRDELGNTIEVLVALLDVMDAPSDPDEPDFRTRAPDDLANHRNDGLPGDPEDGEPVGDELDHAWPEWHLRGKRRVTAGGYETAPVGFFGGVGSEDDEDDDPAGVHDEDGSNTLLGRSKHDGPGCIISDPDLEHDGQEPDHGGYCGVYGIDQTGPVNAPPGHFEVL